MASAEAFPNINVVALAALKYLCICVQESKFYLLRGISFFFSKMLLTEALINFKLDRKEGVNESIPLLRQWREAPQY